jgi:hypothetical protein
MTAMLVASQSRLTAGSAPLRPLAALAALAGPSQPGLLYAIGLMIARTATGLPVREAWMIWLLPM